MSNLNNNQLKHLAYFAMGLIVIILILNIFLSKINDNYNKKSTFESFTSLREGFTGNLGKFPKIDKGDEDTIHTFCKNKKNIDDMLDEIPKLVAINTINATEHLKLAYSSKDESTKTTEFYKFDMFIQIVENLNKLENNLKSIQNVDCRSSSNYFRGSKKKSDDSDSDSDSNSSPSKKSKKKKKGFFSF